MVPGCVALISLYPWEVLAYLRRTGGVFPRVLLDSRTSPLLRALRLKALHEISGEVVTEPALEDLLDCRGEKMALAPESAPGPRAMRYNNQIQGAAFLHDQTGDDC